MPRVPRSFLVVSAYTVLWTWSTVGLLLDHSENNGLRYANLLLLGLPWSFPVADLGGGDDTATILWLSATCLLNTLLAICVIVFVRRRRGQDALSG